MCQRASLHSTAVLNTKRAGRHRRTVNQDKPLTYEEANLPDKIGVRKGWNSHSTANLIDGLRQAEIAQEDIVIRRIAYGIWPKMILSDVVIKRKGNEITVNFMAFRALHARKFYFLIGFTEQLLTQLLKCVVKVEIQTIGDPEELTYKYI